MGLYRWDVAKNNKLIQERGVSFEEVLLAIERGHLLDIIENPNQEKYSGQKVFVIERNRYFCALPLIYREGDIFLRTLIPTRKLTKRYLGRKRS